MSFSRRTLSLVTILLVFVGLGGGVAWRLLDGSDEGPAAALDPGAEGQDPTAGEGTAEFSATVAQPVRGAVVILDTLWIPVRAAGQAEAFRRTSMNAQVEGLVSALPVRENRTVEAGATLLQIDTTEHALGVAQARADLLGAEAD
jgi:multidrug efflux pump subunit AcrA (membrane-fusion protein)